MNSIAAQELASDYTDPYHSELVGGGLAAPVGAFRWTLDVTRERQRALSVHAIPASGVFQGPVFAAPVQAWRAVARAERPTSLAWLGTELRASAEVRLMHSDGDPLATCGAIPCSATRVLRGAMSLDLERPMGPTRVVSRSFGAIASGSPLLIAQELVFLGGPMSAPGYDYHSLVGDRAFSQRLELQFPVPFPAIPLGRFGRSPSSATLAPHATVTAVGGGYSATEILRGAVPFSPPDPLSPRDGLHPSLGLSLITGFNLLRFDLSYGQRVDRWVFSVDVTRAFWSIL